MCHSRSGIIHRNCLRLNWILSRPGSICLSEESMFFPSFHSSHSIQASSIAIHNRHQEEILGMNTQGKVAPISVSFCAWLQFELQLFRSCCITGKLFLFLSARGETDTLGSHSDNPTETLPSQRPRQVLNDECLKNQAILLGIWLLI